METKYLMVNDWYYDQELNKPRMWHQLQFFEAYGNPTYMALCQPLPLTEEILKANGYRKYLNIFEHPCAFDIHYRDYGFCFYGFDDDKYPVTSVHELQHALRICGLNELADNFKLKEE